MVSRRARKRDRTTTKASSPMTSVNTKPEVVYFPKFYWLFEHDTKVTVIRIPDFAGQKEVEEMMRRGNAMCNHQDKLGECISIESATIDDWLSTHSG